MGKYNSRGQRDIERLEKELNTKIYTTRGALAEFNITHYFLTKVSDSKLKLQFNCYEEHLYDGKILEEEVKNGVEYYYSKKNKWYRDLKKEE